jgi:hypothetical protein
MAVKVVTPGQDAGLEENGIDLGTDILGMFVDNESNILKSVETYLSTLEDIFSLDKKTKAVKVEYFDKDRYQTNYSFAMVSQEFKNGNKTKVGFNVLLFTATGVDGLTPMEILERKRIDNMVEIPTIALDKIVVTYCIDSLISEGHKSDDIITAEGFIINDGYTEDDTELLIKQASTMTNAITAKVIKYGFNLDADAQFRAKLEKLSNLTYDVSSVSGDCIMDVMGSPYFVEWQTRASAKQNAKETMNRTSGKMNVGTTYGHIGCVMHRGKMKVQVAAGQYGFVEQEVIKSTLIPTVNVVVADPTLPTDTSVLTLLLGTLPVVSRWKEILAANIKVGRNPGVLNQIIDINNEKNQGKVPKKIKINGSESIDKKVAELSKFYADKAVVVIDAPKFGFGSSQLSTYVKASNGDEDAIDAIMLAANKLTGGKTAGKIDRTKLFVRKSISLPDGTYLNSANKRAPLAMLDEQRFAEMTDDETLIIRFSNALAGKVDAQHALYPNSFDELMDIYRMLDEKFNTQIDIRGVRTRVFVNSAFLLEVKNRLQESKINVVVPNHTQARQTVVFADNSELLNAGIDASMLSFENGYGSDQNNSVAGGNPYAYQM